MEPILTPDESRLILLPIVYDDLWALYKTHEACVWKVAEVDLVGDIKDWNSLKKDEQTFIKHILAFFAGSEGRVIENVATNFIKEVQVAEAGAFYSIQLFMENVHAEMYGLLIQTYVTDLAEQRELFQAIFRLPCVKAKSDWAKVWQHSGRSFAERLIAFAAVECIHFSSSFCAIFWLKKRGLMPGLTFSNEMISRDEGLHVMFAVALYGHLRHPLATETVHAIVESAVDAEKIFVDSILPNSLIGMNRTMMKQYVEFVGDYLLGLLKLPKRYNTPNPFDWMVMISLEGKTNFFEKRVGEYQKAMEPKCALNFSTEADF